MIKVLLKMNEDNTAAPLVWPDLTSKDNDYILNAGIDFLRDAVIVTRLHSLYQEMLAIELEWRTTGGVDQPEFYTLQKINTILQQAQTLIKVV